MTLLFIVLLLGILCLLLDAKQFNPPPTRRRRWLPFLATVALAVGAVTGPAHAAETVSTARSWLDVLLVFLGSELGYGIVGTVGALALAELRRRGINATILDAVENGAGLAYSRLVRAGYNVSTPGAVVGAVAEGAEYAASRVPGYLAKRGIDPETLHVMVDAKLGKLMAADPALSVQAWRVPAA